MRRSTHLSTKQSFIDLDTIHQQANAFSLAATTLYARYHDPTFFAPLCHQPSLRPLPRFHAQWHRLLTLIHPHPILP